MFSYGASSLVSVILYAQERNNQVMLKRTAEFVNLSGLSAHYRKNNKPVELTLDGIFASVEKLVTDGAKEDQKSRL